MKKSLQNILPAAWNLTKLTFAGAVVFAIAFSFGVFDERIEVKETQADIVDFGDATKTAQFVDALDRLGHDNPRAFDLNGNVVYFSTESYRKDPIHVYQDYQEEFHRSGINSKAYEKIENDDPDYILAAVRGEIVPLKMDENYISMGGMLTRGDAETEEEYTELIYDAAEGPAALFRGHRHIEIVKDKDGMGSEAIAMFSGEDFNYDKMKPGYDGPGANPDAIFPSCPGCTRLTRFSDLNADSPPFTINSYETPRTADSTTKFYVESMRRRGWEMTEASAMFYKLKKHVGFEGDDATQIQFSKNGEFMTVLMYPNKEGGLDVHGTRTY